MNTETIKYQYEGKEFHGYLAEDPSTGGDKPAVIIAHAWKGKDAFAHQKAEEMAKLGYIGFAADLYGEGKTVETNDEAAALMSPLFTDRKELRGRIVAAYQEIAKKSKKIGAIGFCFGGLTVIELLRSGVDLRGVVSFHGLLGDCMGEMNAQTVPSEKMKGSLLVLHGYKDPLAPQKDVITFQKEMDEANVDWQMHIYGNTAHAFTNPNANDPEFGLIYNPVAERRSLKSMFDFFNEVFE